MNSVAQKLLQENFSSLYNSISSYATLYQYRICGIPYNDLIRQGGPADITVLESEMKNNSSDPRRRNRGHWGHVPPKILQ